MTPNGTSAVTERPMAAGRPALAMPSASGRIDWVDYAKGICIVLVVMMHSVLGVEAATGQRAKIDVFGTDYPTQDGSCIRDFIHVTDLSQAHRSALAYLRNGGASTTLNCGYGRGYSVLETIDAVRRVSGRSFAVQYAPRRPGDIMTMVADTSRIRGLLDWKPQYDDLETIAAHALAWEDKLFRERHGELRHAASA
jgi:UDP-glucose 4-epimerase